MLQIKHRHKSVRTIFTQFRFLTTICIFKLIVSFSELLSWYFCFCF